MELDETLEFLKEAREPIPIAYNPNWSDALKQTEYNYKKKLLADAIPAAFDDYKMRLESGIEFPKSAFNETLYQDSIKRVDSIKTEILGGRKLLGEPEDLNF